MYFKMSQNGRGKPKHVACNVRFNRYVVFDDLKERRGYSHLKQEALDRTMWRAGFGRGFGPVVRQTTE
jgi:hypothetical protein